MLRGLVPGGSAQAADLEVWTLAKPAISSGYRPRGAAAPAATPRPHSIATLHCAIVFAITRMVPRCPCCARRFRPNTRRNL